jgi:hypothetical protein
VFCVPESSLLSSFLLLFCQRLFSKWRSDSRQDTPTFPLPTFQVTFGVQRTCFFPLSFWTERKEEEIQVAHMRTPNRPSASQWRGGSARAACSYFFLWVLQSNKYKNYSHLIMLTSPNTSRRRSHPRPRPPPPRPRRSFSSSISTGAGCPARRTPRRRPPRPTSPPRCKRQNTSHLLKEQTLRNQDITPLQVQGLSHTPRPEPSVVSVVWLFLTRRFQAYMGQLDSQLVLSPALVRSRCPPPTFITTSPPTRRYPPVGPLTPGGSYWLHGPCWVSQPDVFWTAK